MYSEGYGNSNGQVIRDKASVDNVFYHDLHFTYDVTESAKVSLGIDNLFDEEAPFITSWNDSNTDVFTYDLMGQRWYLQASYEF